MKLIKYVLLTLMAIAVSGLIWLSKSTPVGSQAKVLLNTEPPLEQVIADDTVVKFKLQAVDNEKQPLAGANVRVRISTPAKTPWFTSDFPIVEGTELLDFTASASQGNVEFEQVLPIRGKYNLTVAVNPQDKEAFEAFEQPLIINISENAVKYRNLAILAVILLGVGSGSGWILGGNLSVQEDEIAPQPVRMLLSGITVVAIAILLLVNAHAEVGAFHSHTEAVAVPTSSPAIVKNQVMQLELLGDTQAVVGNLATQAVKITNPNTGEPVTDTQVRVESVASESDTLMFAYQGTPDATGKLTWQEQFFDGAPHRVTATVIPLANASEQLTPLQVSQSIEVEAIAPPLFIRLISLLYFTLIFAVGLICGFWGKRRNAI
jgi:hypothetical protein